MTTAFDQLQTGLQTQPHTWLVTGVAGFIGSNLLEVLLKLNQRAVGLDNFATGHPRNLAEVQTLVTPQQWANFNFIQGDIRNLDDCQTPPRAWTTSCTKPPWAACPAAWQTLSPPTPPTLPAF